MRAVSQPLEKGACSTPRFRAWDDISSEIVDRSASMALAIQIIILDVLGI
jgi:hypothetical protein